MFSTQPGDSRRTAFTLVELLTVVAIISLLIGILLPSLSRARDQAKKAKTAGLISAIDKGLEMFHNDFGQYPDSTFRRDPIDWSGSMQGLSSNVELSGGHWLARALVGHDINGLDAQGLGMKTPSGGGFSIKAKDMEEGSTVTIDRKGRYMDGEVFFRDDDALKFPGLGGPGDNSGSTPTQRLVVADDSFNSPIIYYRANERATRPFCYDGVDEDPPMGVYRQKDNAMFTGSDQGGENGWDFAGVGPMPSSASAPVHPLSDYGKLQGSAPNWTLDPVDSFMGTLHSPGALKSTGTLKAVNPDRFLLITAGKDGRFGNRDDITNFKSGL